MLIKIRSVVRGTAWVLVASSFNLFVLGLASSARVEATAADSAEAPEQSPNESALAEIVVTARKQKEALLEVPVAATAVGGDTLVQNAVTDLSNLGTLMPSVNLDKAPLGGVGSFTIRGIGSSSYDAGIEQAVSTVIDGVQTSRGAFIETGLLDVAQVEVLKGPQALFFGKNSPGGVVSLQSNGPTDELAGYLRTGYEFESNERRVEGAISGPLTDTIRARLALSGDELQGWIHNVAAPTGNPFAVIPGFAPTIDAPPYTYNGLKRAIGRLTVEYRPTSDFTATVRFIENYKTDNGQNADLEVTRCPPGQTVPVFLGVPDLANDCAINNRSAVGPVQPPVAGSDGIFRNGVPYGHFHSYVPSLTLDYTHGPVDITSTTGYMAYRYEHVSNSATTYGFDALGEDERFHQFSQEVRAVTKFQLPVNFSAGVYYEKTDLTDHYPNGLFPLPADPVTGSFLTYILDAHNTGETYSAFGQARWAVVPKVELAAGLRYSHDKVTGAVGNSFVNGNGAAVLPLTAAGEFFSGERSFNNTSPEVTLSWKPLDETLLYGSYKTGYKSGGATTLAIIPITFDPASLFYKPEKIHGFEVGAKTLQLDGRLRVTAAAFTYTYTGLQVSNFNQATFEIQALNVGGMRTRGFEIAADFKPISSLTLSASVGDADARYTSFHGIACYGGQVVGCVDGSEDLTGQQKFRAPQWTGNVGFSYQAPAFGHYLYGITGGMRFSSSYFTEENNNPASIQGSYQTYDAGVNLKTDDNRWLLAFLGRNLSSRQYMIASLDAPNAAPGTIESTISRPRELWLELTYRY